MVKLYARDALFFGTVSPILYQGTGMIRSDFGGLPGNGQKIVIRERRMVILNDEAVLCVGFYELNRMWDARLVPGAARFTMVSQSAMTCGSSPIITLRGVRIRRRRA